MYLNLNEITVLKFIAQSFNNNPTSHPETAISMQTSISENNAREILENLIDQKLVRQLFKNDDNNSRYEITNRGTNLLNDIETSDRKEKIREFRDWVWPIVTATIAGIISVLVK
ncbi:winged helix-turn-helix domain-containing protein [Lentilactobacillus sp. SPB1-3]|uniref:Winged helix-turn-helix domain-containing protein n=1 Tax=Lentilactobacillus terminaliae TaxID=3003483 RepID=A0ACD5DDA8_9LACO|nr:winged helix-turn-helix domain-containing protein [Lentilactobacillus sp. SPB1-3]MCZ0978064.1 hypothetical protein [Lentilactobacillus sp. SPB1-3]